MSKITQEKKAKGKKPTEKAAVMESLEQAEPAAVCCKCRHHDNKPSFCRKHKKYMARKTAACSDAK